MPTAQVTSILNLNRGRVNMWCECSKEMKKPNVNPRLLSAFAMCLLQLNSYNEFVQLLNNKSILKILKR